MKQAILTVRKACGNQMQYNKITIDDVIVTMVALIGSTVDDSRIREQVSLSFAKVEQEYTLQNAQGGAGGTVTSGYNLNENKEV